MENVKGKFMKRKLLTRNAVKTIWNLICEVKILIIAFIIPYKDNNSVFETPSIIKRMGTRIKVLDFAMFGVTIVFAYLLTATNALIEHNLIFLGIILFFLYRGERVIGESYKLYSILELNKYEVIFSDIMVSKAAEIVLQTSGKVLKFDDKRKIYMLMSNEEIINNVKRYLTGLWKCRIEYKFNILRLVSIIFMLIVSVITNTVIPQYIFIPLIIIFFIISFLSSAYASINRKDYSKEKREFENKKDVAVNDILRVPGIVNNDLNMRINKYKELVNDNSNNVINFHKKLNLSNLVLVISEVVGYYGIIFFYLLSIEWNAITLATIANMTATLVIVEVAFSKIKSIVNKMNSTNETINGLKVEKNDIDLILDVYYKELKNKEMSKPIDVVNIPEFSIKYIEESENDKAFSLTMKESLVLNKGEVAVLYGPSGSGKSTFMKMLTQRIRIEKSVEIPSTSRFLFYDEKLCFGSMTIYEELFCREDKVDLKKMQEILENLHLWQEINENCVDIWKWMKEKQFLNSLSNGQKQRLILAKMLYWLDDDIDVVVLDECTSGLDDKLENDSIDAEKVLSYVIRYCNESKKRIVVISTHQNIDGVKSNLNEFSIINLHFLKENGENTIKLIK